MINHTGLVHIGQMAIFYVPKAKLDLPEYGRFNQMLREFIHEFLMDHYDAYTLETGNTVGFWRSRRGNFFVDVNARYEVSFDGKDRIPRFVEFLREVCALMQEEAIYLTMGRHSYLVEPDYSYIALKEENEI